MELIVVIAVLAVITAVAVPVYNNNTRNAGEKACILNIKNLQAAVILYLNDNEDLTADDVDEINVLAPYVQNNIIPECPVDSDNSYTVENGIVSCSGIAEGETEHTG